MSLTFGSAPIWGRSTKSAPVVGSFSPSVSHLSSSPSPSVSWTVVLNTIAPQDKHATELGSPGATFVVADESPPVRNGLLTFTVRLSHADPREPGKGSVALGTELFSGVSC